MEFWKFMFVPTILFLVIVAPMWITMHYRSVNRSSRSLNLEDKESIEHLLEMMDKLTERIGTLESILDADHPQWQQQVNRHERGEERRGEDKRGEDKRGEAERGEQRSNT